MALEAKNESCFRQNDSEVTFQALLVALVPRRVQQEQGPKGTQNQFSFSRLVARFRYFFFTFYYQALRRRLLDRNPP